MMSNHQRDMWSTMSTTTLFVIAGNWKQPKYASTEEWIKKVWYLYTMEYYSAEKKDILKFAGKYRDLEKKLH